MTFRQISPLLLSLVLLLPSCSVKSRVQQSAFSNGVLISTEMWTVVSSISLEFNSYTITTTDNSHGQMNRRVSEEGDFRIRGHKLFIEPRIRLVSPELIPGGKRQGQIVYTDESRSDSFYIGGRGIKDISNYVYVSKDSLNTDNIELLGFANRIYHISLRKEKTTLSAQSNTGEVYTQYRFKN